MQATTIEHFVPVAAGHALRVLELPPVGAANGMTIVCLHGVFSDARFFCDHNQQGAASFFAARGYRVFVGNFRGHGGSRWPVGRRRWNWSFDTLAGADVPALLHFAATRARGPCFALGHSLGGCALLAALAINPPLQRLLAGAIVLSAAINDYSDGGRSKRLQLPLAAILARGCGHFPARRLHLGPDDEPPLLMQQFRDWAAHGAFRSVDHQVDYWEALREVTLPVYAGVGAADTFHASPARARKLVAHLCSTDMTFEVHGRALGLTRDFGHLDVARGAAAEREILPRVDAWLRRHDR